MKNETVKKSRPRTISRVAATQALFQIDQSQEDPEVVISEFITFRLKAITDHSDVEEGGLPPMDVDLFRAIVRQTVKNQETLDVHIEQSLVNGWSLKKIDPVLRAILRAGGAELMIIDGVPRNVVINEYLDVAKSFFDGREPAIINAILEHLDTVLPKSRKNI